VSIEDEGEQKKDSGKGFEEHKEESKPVEERKQAVTVRKIQIIKKG
jgi:hypothetical protein